jgi:hypothetical protein
MGRWTGSTWPAHGIHATVNCSGPLNLGSMVRILLKRKGIESLIFTVDSQMDGGS